MFIHCRGSGYLIEFTDPLLLKIVCSSQFRSQLENIVATHSVLLNSTPTGVTLTPSGSSDNSAAAKDDLITLAQSVAITTEPLLLHCCNIPLLVNDSVICEIQKIDGQYGIDIKVVTTSGEFVSFSDFAAQVSHLVSDSSSDHLLLVSQVSRFAEMKLNHKWCYEDASGQMRSFPPSIDDLLNENYYPFRCGVFSFTLDSIKYNLDFSQMRVEQEGSQNSGRIDKEPPLWTYRDAVSTGVAYKFSRSFDIVTSQEIELAVQYGVPGLLNLGESQVSFDVLTNPVILYDTTKGCKWCLHRKPPLPESRDSLLTLAIHCRHEDTQKIAQTLKIALQKQVTTQIYTIPPNVTRPLQCLLVNIARQFCVQSRVFLDVDNSAVTIQLEGERECVSAVKMHLLEVCQQKIVPLCIEAPVTIPHQWKPGQTSEVETVPVPVRGEEWNELEILMRRSLPSLKLLEVMRVQNLMLWRRYCFFKSLMSRKNNGQVNEKLLFHGTRATNPKTIISSEKGFDFRYGSEDCLWGKGTYFAVDANYCDCRFAFLTSEEKRQLFVARVLTGRSIKMPKPNRTLKEPPRMSDSGTDAYDSVNGFVQQPVHAQIYVIYDHDKAYPAYLLTYRT